MACKIDETDRRILELLRENARIPNAKLGKKVGLSEPAARRRVANLVSRGVIRRFTVDVEEGGGVQAQVSVSTSPHATFDKISKALSGIAGLGSMWEISGDMDMRIILSAADMDSLNRKIDEIRAMPEIRRTKTSIILKKWR